MIVLLTAGQRLGNYCICRLIASGGMGEVYEVEHVKLHVKYALKIFSFDGQEVELLRKRFEAEGKILARLNHPNLVRVIDLDINEELGLLYFVMDLILCDDGGPRSLADIEPGSVDEDTIAGWFLEMCDALTYIHSKGILHRDIKLNNILLDKNSHIVLTDFGISKFADPKLSGALGVTATMPIDSEKKLIMGTVAYMAPELLAGHEASVSSDVYAMAVAFFKLLTNIWYDPSLEHKKRSGVVAGIDVVRLLELFDRNWRSVIPEMLKSDVKRRNTNLLWAKNVVAGVAPKIRMRSLMIGIVSAVLGLLSLCAVLYFWENVDVERKHFFDRAFSIEHVRMEVE